MTLLLVASQAFACGGFFGKEGQTVVSDAQQSILHIDAESITVEYRVRYEGTASDFAWVVPVLGSVTAVEVGDEATFNELQNATAPQVYDGRDQSSSDSPNCGCFAGSAASLSDKSGEFGDTGASGGGIDVTDQGFVGDYEYFVLAADDADSLRTWLSDNGFDISTAGDVIDAYVSDERGYEFVAVRVAADAASPEMETVFDPLRIKIGPALDGELHVQYPARMNSTSTAETNEIQLYVFGTGAAEVGGGWSASSFDGDIALQDGDDPDTVYAEKLQDVGDEGQKLALVWSNQYREDGWLTRFDVILDPATQTADIDFSDSGDTSKVVETSLVYEDEGGSVDIATRAAMFLGIGALGAALRRLRR